MTTASSVTASDGVTLAVHRYTEIDARSRRIILSGKAISPAKLRLFARFGIRQT